MNLNRKFPNFYAGCKGVYVVMIPTDMQWNALLQRHATVTVTLDDRKVTGDLYNVTDEQVILIVQDKEGLFEVLNRADVRDMSW